jgi:hypothetical protein
MPLTEEEHPVGDLCPGGEHESFRVSVTPSHNGDAEVTSIWHADDRSSGGGRSPATG